MAASEDINESPPAPIAEEVPKWKLARHGINLLINNKQEEAEALFKQYPDSLQMYAGYAFAVFIVSINHVTKEPRTCFYLANFKLLKLAKVYLFIAKNKAIQTFV